MRRRSGGEESWLLSYADLITNLLLFFVVLLTAANLSKGRMQQIAKSLSGAEQPASLESIRKEIDQRIAEFRIQMAFGNCHAHGHRQPRRCIDRSPRPVIRHDQRQATGQEHRNNIILAEEQFFEPRAVTARYGQRRQAEERNLSRGKKSRANEADRKNSDTNHCV